MRILVIEDDRKLSDIVQRGLTEAGYVVDAAYDGEEGKDMAEIIPYDILILDIILPKLDGIHVCEALRQKKMTSRIIMLTSRDSIEDRVTGLDNGADDYMVKPFAFDELLARIRALLRRDVKNGSNLLQVGELRINTMTREVNWRGEEIKLTAKEYSLLEYFLHNPNIVITRRMLEDHVWNFSLESESNLVDVYIRRLRQKITDDERNNPIETIRGIGYRLRSK